MKRAGTGYLIGDDVGVLRGGWSKGPADGSTYDDGAGNHVMSWSFGLGQTGSIVGSGGGSGV
jgi:hypothetical protein